MLDVKSYLKGGREPVSAHFNSSEFDCRCSSSECRETRIHPDLVKFLEVMRALTRCPIVIRSGFRCSAHQEEVRESGIHTAVGRSTHEDGRAADIFTGIHSGLGLELLARQAGFRAVGVGARWVHVDLRSDKDRRWTY